MPGNGDMTWEEVDSALEGMEPQTSGNQLW